MLKENEVDSTKLLDELGRLIGRFHAAGWTHGDLTLKNVLLVSDRPHLIDLDHAVRFPPLVRFGGRVHDLRKVRVSARHVMGRKERRAWMHAYADERGLSRPTVWLYLALASVVPKRRRRPWRAASRALFGLFRSREEGPSDGARSGS